MTMLQDIQQDFLESFDKLDFAKFLKHVTESDKLAAKDRIAVNQSNITHGLIGSLQSTYPVCKNIIGLNNFTILAKEYIKKHPSTSASLFAYGDCFAEFVAEFAPAKEMPYLADLCRLEFAWQEAYCAAVGGDIDYAALQGVAADQQNNLKFYLQPGCGFIESTYAIDDIWHDYKEAAAKDVACMHNAVRLLIWRNGLEVEILKLSPDKYEFLKLIAAGYNLADVCEKLLAKDENYNLTSSLTFMLSHGLCMSFSL